MEGLNDAILLGLDCRTVIGLRLLKMGWGGAEAVHEAHTMCSEKVVAAHDAALILLRGGTSDQVLSHYRGLVAANASRLSPAS